MAGTGETAGSDSEEEEEFGLERVIFSPDAVRRYERISKELKKLQFSNPGPQMRGTSVESRFRARPQTQQRPMPQASQLSENRVVVPPPGELCDCLDPHCPGCFLPCPRCKSNKCGVECQGARGWDYEREYSRDHLCTGDSCPICRYYSQ